MGDIVDLKDRIVVLEKESQGLKDNLYTSENKHTDNSNSKVEMLKKISDLESLV